MTHDELLHEIDMHQNWQYSNAQDVTAWDALRAVVELAGKDIQHESYVWLDGYDYAMKQIIQAIEKELG
jgi:hypothetical protein